jgi:hypothetical protein
MKPKTIFLFLFMLLSTFLIYVILFVRVIDVTPADQLGLLSHMPSFYVPVLILTALTCLVAYYFKETGWSIAFATLFVGLFALTIWFIEPLHTVDTFYHFGSVTAVMQDGHISLSAPHLYYFDYPGSTFFGAIFLEITGMGSISFLKIFFPLLQTIVFCLGVAVIVKTIFKSWLPVGPSLLLLTIFGYGGLFFSPISFGWMIIPLLLFTLIMREKRAYFLCFILLSFSLVMSHPTTSAFLTIVLPGSVLFFLLFKRVFNERLNTLIVCVSIFVVMVLSWSYLVSSFTLSLVALTIKSAIQTLFNNSQGALGLIYQNPYPVFAISLLRRIFTVLSTVLAVTVLALCLKKIWKPSKIGSHEKEWLSLSIAFICVGILLFLVFSISALPAFNFTYSFIFGLFGVAIMVGLLPRSRKVFFLLLIITVTLVTPAFITKNGYEYYDLLREPIMPGMQFTGTYITNVSSIVLSPFDHQLYAFMSYDNWANIESIDYSGDRLLSQVERCDYFIYRTDGLYFNYGDVNQTQIYLQVSNSMLNRTNFNLIYSNPDYKIYARCAPVG